MRRDEILSSAVCTFCYRFEQMFTMLERHDFEHYLTKIFEEGSLGRVYSRLADACRDVESERKRRELFRSIRRERRRGRPRNHASGNRIRNRFRVRFNVAVRIFASDAMNFAFFLRRKTYK